MQKVELQPDEICRYISELQTTVAVVCKSSSFRTSAKSCQFLRFIVQRTLGGKVDELKERVIGIELLGREASYDTGSDAGVRVRATAGSWSYAAASDGTLATTVVLADTGCALSLHDLYSLADRAGGSVRYVLANGIPGPPGASV